MNEKEFKARWDQEKPIYNAWGKYIVENISKELINKGKNLDVFLKSPASYRLKDDKSLIDKAFYRPNKNYTNPYEEIEDKVGARFVVLLLDDINLICNIVENSELWQFDPCKHFIKDREEQPLLFTYQSVHYILRPKSKIEYESTIIDTSIPCELQIRTLLQHAHAELTHDAIYKAKKRIQPKVHRTVAKSMALIETTDDFFSQVTKQLNHGPLEDHHIIEKLDSIYLRMTSIRSVHQKSSIAIWDEFEQLIDSNLVGKIEGFFSNPDYDFLSNRIRDNYNDNILYQQSTVLFIYWMLKNKKRRLLQDWPLDFKLLDPLANDIGVSIID